MRTFRLMVDLRPVMSAVLADPEGMVKVRFPFRHHACPKEGYAAGIHFMHRIVPVLFIPEAVMYRCGLARLAERDIVFPEQACQFLCDVRDRLVYGAQCMVLLQEAGLLCFQCLTHPVIRMDRRMTAHTQPGKVLVGVAPAFALWNDMVEMRDLLSAEQAFPFLVMADLFLCIRVSLQRYVLEILSGRTLPDLPSEVRQTGRPPGPCPCPTETSVPFLPHWHGC